MISEEKINSSYDCYQFAQYCKSKCSEGMQMLKAWEDDAGRLFALGKWSDSDELYLWSAEELSSGEYSELEEMIIDPVTLDHLKNVILG